jgi:CRP-like cAMP-binding protein
MRRTDRRPLGDRSAKHPTATAAGEQQRAGLAAVLGRILPESSGESRAELVRHARLRPFARHERIVSQGFEPLVALCVRGHLGGWRSDAGGKQHMIRIIGPEDLLSLAALRGGPSPVDLVGLDSGMIAAWPGDLLLGLARGDAGLGIDLLDHAIAGSRRLAERLDRITFDSVTRRLARILWMQRELLFGERPLLSRPELADLAGATREMTGRVIRDLERRRIVRRVGPTGLELRDAAALRAEAGIEPGDELAVGVGWRAGPTVG